MATKKENKKNKSKNLNPPKEKKTIAEKVQLRLSQLDKKSANISKQITSLQKRIDDSTKLKSRIENLKIELAKVKRAKEMELDEIALMRSTYTKPNPSQSEKLEIPKTPEDAIAEAAHQKLS
jgi:hypothetical protein